MSLWFTVKGRPVAYQNIAQISYAITVQKCEAMFPSVLRFLSKDMRVFCIGNELIYYHRS